MPGPILHVNYWGFNYGLFKTPFIVATKKWHLALMRQKRLFLMLFLLLSVLHNFTPIKLSTNLARIKIILYLW